LKKVLVFSPYYQPHIGGLERYAHSLNLFLKESGFDVTVITACIPAGNSYEEDVEGIKVLRVPSYEIIPNFPIYNPFSKHLRDIYKDNYVATISHTRFFISSFFALIYSRVHKTPLIHVEHGSGYVKMDNFLFSVISKIYDNTFGRLIFRFSDVNVAVSEATARFINKFDKRETEIIPYGVAIDQNNTIKIKNNLVPKIIYLGRLIDGKGVDLLLRASKDLDINHQLVIVGDGPTRRSLENLAKQLKNRSVVFVGEKKPEDALKILKTANVLVSPSYSEGFGITILEAGSLGVPIISTKTGIAETLIKDGVNGFFIEKGSSGSIVASLRLILKDVRLRKSMAENMYRDITLGYNQKDIFKKYLQIINNRS